MPFDQCTFFDSCYNSKGLCYDTFMFNSTQMYEDRLCDRSDVVFSLIMLLNINKYLTYQNGC